MSDTINDAISDIYLGTKVAELYNTEIESIKQLLQRGGTCASLLAGNFELKRFHIVDFLRGIQRHGYVLYLCILSAQDP